MFLELQHPFDGRPGGVAQKEAFFPRQALGVDGGILIGHLGKAVDNIEVDVFGQDVLPDTLGKCKDKISSSSKIPVFMIFF